MAFTKRMENEKQANNKNNKEWIIIITDVNTTQLAWRSILRIIQIRMVPWVRTVADGEWNHIRGRVCERTVSWRR